MHKIVDEFSEIPSGNPRWRRRHPEAAKISDRERRKRYVSKDPLRALLKNVKHRAKNAKLEFAISKSDVELTEYCPVLGIPLVRNSEKGHWDFSPSIDRIDNTKGYIPGNVKIISWRANSLKSDATIEELELVLKYMKEHVPSAV